MVYSQADDVGLPGAAARNDISCYIPPLKLHKPHPAPRATFPKGEGYSAFFDSFSRLPRKNAPAGFSPYPRDEGAGEAIPPRQALAEQGEPMRFVT